MSTEEFKNIIETRLDIKGSLILDGRRILPNKSLLTKKYIKKMFLDDLFSRVDRKVNFTPRFFRFVSDISVSSNVKTIFNSAYLELKGDN